jgi:hypothetical protein
LDRIVCEIYDAVSETWTDYGQGGAAALYEVHSEPAGPGVTGTGYIDLHKKGGGYSIVAGSPVRIYTVNGDGDITARWLFGFVVRRGEAIKYPSNMVVYRLDLQGLNILFDVLRLRAEWDYALELPATSLYHQIVAVTRAVQEPPGPAGWASESYFGIDAGDTGIAYADFEYPMPGRIFAGMSYGEMLRALMATAMQLYPDLRPTFYLGLESGNPSTFGSVVLHVFDRAVQPATAAWYFNATGGGTAPNGQPWRPWYGADGFKRQLENPDLRNFGQSVWEEPNTSMGTQMLYYTGTPIGGTFTLSHDGKETGPIAWNADAATLETQLEGFPHVGAGNVSVIGGPLPLPVTIEFATAPGTLYPDDRNILWVQTLNTTGPVGGPVTAPPTGGYFTLSFGGETTAHIDWDATAGEVRLALEALSNIAPGDVDVAGGPFPGTPLVITFNPAAETLGFSAAGLTGGDHKLTMITGSLEVEPAAVVSGGAIVFEAGDAYSITTYPNMFAAHRAWMAAPLEDAESTTAVEASAALSRSVTLKSLPREINQIEVHDYVRPGQWVGVQVDELGLDASDADPDVVAGSTFLCIGTSIDVRNHGRMAVFTLTLKNRKLLPGEDADEDPGAPPIERDVVPPRAPTGLVLETNRYNPSTNMTEMTIGWTISASRDVADYLFDAVPDGYPALPTLYPSDRSATITVPPGRNVTVRVLARDSSGNISGNAPDGGNIGIFTSSDRVSIDLFNGSFEQVDPLDPLQAMGWAPFGAAFLSERLPGITLNGASDGLYYYRIQLTTSDVGPAGIQSDRFLVTAGGTYEANADARFDEASGSADVFMFKVRFYDGDDVYLSGQDAEVDDLSLSELAWRTKSIIFAAPPAAASADILLLNIGDGGVDPTGYAVGFDRVLVWDLAEPTRAGALSSHNKGSLNLDLAMPGAARLLTAAVATDTTLTMRVAPDSIAGGSTWMYIDPYTIRCEMRKITGISGNTLTLDRALSKAHAATAAVIYSAVAMASPTLWGAKGDGATHPIGTATGLTLGEIQAYLPHVTSTADELDWAAAQAAADEAVGGAKSSIPWAASPLSSADSVRTARAWFHIPSGDFLFNRPLFVRNVYGLKMEGAGDGTILRGVDMKSGNSAASADTVESTGTLTRIYYTERVGAVFAVGDRVTVDIMTVSSGFMSTHNSTIASIGPSSGNGTLTYFDLTTPIPSGRIVLAGFRIRQSFVVSSRSPASGESTYGLPRYQIFYTPGVSRTFAVGDGIEIEVYNPSTLVSLTYRSTVASLGTDGVLGPYLLPLQPMPVGYHVEAGANLYFFTSIVWLDGVARGKVGDFRLATTLTIPDTLYYLTWTAGFPTGSPVTAPPVAASTTQVNTHDVAALSAVFRLACFFADTNEQVDNCVWNHCQAAGAWYESTAQTSMLYEYGFLFGNSVAGNNLGQRVYHGMARGVRTGVSWQGSTGGWFGGFIQKNKVDVYIAIHHGEIMIQNVRSEHSERFLETAIAGNNANILLQNINWYSSDLPKHSGDYGYVFYAFGGGFITIDNFNIRFTSTAGAIPRGYFGSTASSYLQVLMRALAVVGVDRDDFVTMNLSENVAYTIEGYVNSTGGNTPDRVFPGRATHVGLDFPSGGGSALGRDEATGHYRSAGVPLVERIQLLSTQSVYDTVQTLPTGSVINYVKLIAVNDMLAQVTEVDLGTAADTDGFLTMLRSPGGIGTGDVEINTAVNGVFSGAVRLTVVAGASDPIYDAGVRREFEVAVFYTVYS